MNLPLAKPAPAGRTIAIDVLRGAVMVLMVLDHARDFFFGLRVRPTDLAVTTVTLFITRWLTHFCAPVFVFLAGTAAQRYGARHGPERATRFLLGRGLLLIVLELTVIRLCWIPDLGYHFTLIQVIWVLGWSMLALAGLSRLPHRVVLVVGAIIVGGHNLFDGVSAASFGALAPLWKILHQPGMLQLAPGHAVFVSYPLMPWVGLMALGFVFGSLFDRPLEQRRRIMLQLGLGAVAAFIVLRATGIYGDPRPWSHQSRGPVFTFLSFINCEKYPPSLSFLLMTLGPALCALAALDGREPARGMRVLAVFGRVPLLFYVAHLALLRYASAPLALSRFGPGALAPPPGHAGSPELPLWTAYAAWAAALLLLYPLCRWFAALKQRRPDSWLRFV
jgi:uncharacterized membrane protein